MTHCLIGNKAIFSEHFIGWSAAVKANTRTEGHDHNLVVAAEEQEHVTTQDTNHDTAAGEVLQKQVAATDHSLLALAAFVCTYIYMCM